MPTKKTAGRAKQTTARATRRAPAKSARSRAKKRHPNIVLVGIDSLRADHMSLYGYPKLTTPHLEKFARDGVTFERTYSPHIPTTSAYASMLTGRDCFGTQVVALRHKGGLTTEVRTLAEILREEGYDTTCVGFTGNPSSRGFDRYLDYAGWGSWNEGRSPKAQNLNEVAIPELDRMIDQKKPFFLFLRHMDPHAPYLPPEPYERMFYHGNETDPSNKSMDPVMGFKPFCDFFKSWMPPGITDKDYVIAQYDGAIAYMDACLQTIFEQLEARGVARGHHRRHQWRSWRDALRARMLVRPPRHVRQCPGCAADDPLSGQVAARMRGSKASTSTRTWCPPFSSSPTSRSTTRWTDGA